MAQDIGLLLRGLGAAFSNTVPQFRQEMAQERENQFIQQQRQQQMQMRNAEMLQARQTAMYKDAESALKLMAMGDLDGVVALGQERLQLLGNFPDADPSDTARLTQFAMQARAGDREAYNNLSRELLGTVQRGLAMGVLTPPELQETIVKPGETVLRGGEPVFTAPMEAKAPIPRTDEAKLKADLDAGLITQAQYDAGIARLAQGTPQNVWQEAGDLRKEFSGIPAVRQFAEQAGAFGRIEASASNPSAAGDLALIFNYMKVLDPGSTVREGEFANAQNAAGIPERIRALYNNAMQGTRLTETQRSDFLSRARNLYENAERSYMRTYNQYKDIAERRNLPLADALIDYRYQSSMQFPQFFNSQEEADAANLPSGSVFEIPNPEDPDEILQLRVR